MTKNKTNPPMNKTAALANRKGQFTTLSFRNGTKTENFCAKIIKITEQTIRFRDVNSGEIMTKMIKSYQPA